MPSPNMHDRLAAAADVAEVLRDVLDRVERVARLEAALLVVDVRRGIARARRAGAPLHVVNHVERRRAQLAAHELVDGAQQARLAGGEFLAGVGAAAGVHDRREIVGADVALDELLRGQLDALRAQRRGVQIVEHDHVDAAVGGLQVVADVRLDRLRRKQRPLDALERNVDQRKRGDLLRLAVLEDLEVLGLQVGDELALLIEDARVDLDVVDFGAERDRRLLRRLAAGPARAAWRPTRASEVNKKQNRLVIRSSTQSFKMGRQPQL